MDLRTIMFLVAASGANDVPTVEATASGNPATFTTDVKKALAGLTIPFTPIQIGTGDPAPNNVREILGKSEIRILHSGEDTSDPSIVTVSLGDTFYGGSLDAATGILTVEWMINSKKWKQLIASTVGETMSQRLINFDREVVVAGASGVSSANICNVAKYIWSGLSNTTPHFYTGYSSGDKVYRAYVIMPNDIDVETVITIASRLVTPYTVQLDPVTINTVLGENNIWTDTNGSNTVTYLKKDQ